MAEYLTNTTDLTAVADAIRNKGGTSAPLAFPDGFVNGINSIQPELMEKSITANGTYNASDDDVDGYSEVVVNVPSSGPAGPYVEETYERSDNRDKLTKIVLHNYTLLRESMYDANYSSMCSYLTDITFPETLTEISAYCFRGIGIEHLTIPSWFIVTGRDSFYGCPNLIDVDFYGALADQHGAFRYCPNLLYAEIHSDQIRRRYGFEGSMLLEKVWLRETCTQITNPSSGRSLFSGCGNNLTLYVEADSKPSGYTGEWNRYGLPGEDNTKIATVVYGQKTRPW